MFPVHLRLRKSQEFDRIREQGESWRDHHLKVNTARNGLEYSRFGFIVSRRVGGAVTRNLIKRRLRTIVSGLLPEIRDGYDVVVIATPAAAQATYQELEASTGKLFKLASLLLPAREI